MLSLKKILVIKILKKTNNYAYTNIGTPYYMSPELYKHKRYTNKTDIWSIGVVLYELMTFKVPSYLIHVLRCCVTMLFCGAKHCLCLCHAQD